MWLPMLNQSIIYYVPNVVVLSGTFGRSIQLTHAGISDCVRFPALHFKRRLFLNSQNKHNIQFWERCKNKQNEMKSMQWMVLLLNFCDL